MSFTPLIQNATQILVDHLDELTALDQAIGDGDHGLNMKRGAQAIQAKLAEMEGKGLHESLKTMGKTCVAMIGGSSGPVFGTLLMTLGKELPPEPTSQDFALALRASIESSARAFGVLRLSLSAPLMPSGRTASTRSFHTPSSAR
jgi:dihydroxyacetone kinase-like protein